MDLSRTLEPAAAFLDERGSRWALIGGLAMRVSSAGSMSSSAASEPLDLEHGLPVHPEDVLALRRARARSSLGWEEYVAFLAAQPPPSIEELRARPLSSGGPFRIVA